MLPDLVSKVDLPEVVPVKRVVPVTVEFPSKVTVRVLTPPEVGFMVRLLLALKAAPMAYPTAPAMVGDISRL